MPGDLPSMVSGSVKGSGDAVGQADDGLSVQPWPGGHGRGRPFTHDAFPAMLASFPFWHSRL